MTPNAGSSAAARRKPSGPLREGPEASCTREDYDECGCEADEAPGQRLAQCDDERHVTERGA